MRGSGRRVRLPRYCWHLGCILPRVPAISLWAGKTIVALELMWPSQHTYAKYMHVAVPAEGNVTASREQLEKQRDRGVGGRIADRVSSDFAQRIGALEDQTKQLDAKVDTVVEEVAKLGDLLRERLPG